MIRYRGDRVVALLDLSCLAVGETAADRLSKVLGQFIGSHCLREPGSTGRALISVPVDVDPIDLASRLDALESVVFAEPDMVESASDDES